MIQVLLRRIPKRLHAVLLGRAMLVGIAAIPAALLLWSLLARYPLVSKRQTEITEQIALERQTQNLKVELGNQRAGDTTNLLHQASALLIQNEEELALWTQEVVTAGLVGKLRIGVQQGVIENEGATNSFITKRVIQLTVSGQPTFSYPEFVRFVRNHVIEAGKRAELTALQMTGNGNALTSARLEVRLWSGRLTP